MFYAHARRGCAAALTWCARRATAPQPMTAGSGGLDAMRRWVGMTCVAVCGAYLPARCWRERAGVVAARLEEPVRRHQLCRAALAQGASSGGAGQRLP